jgi:hypothetical protein
MITGKSCAIYQLVRDRENRNTSKLLQESLTLLWPQALHLLLLLRTRTLPTQDPQNSRTGNVFCSCDHPRSGPRVVINVILQDSLFHLWCPDCPLSSSLCCREQIVPLSRWRRLMPENISPSEFWRQGGAYW